MNSLRVNGFKMNEHEWACISIRCMAKMANVMLNKWMVGRSVGRSHLYIASNIRQPFQTKHVLYTFQF